jgi:hypothetical protein
VVVVDRAAVEQLCADPAFASRLATVSYPVDKETFLSSD